MSFSDLGLESGLLEAVSALGYTEPTPIQEQAIPPALAGRDIIGCAQTGTGKTAAFILPALQRMGKRRHHRHAGCHSYPGVGRPDRRRGKGLLPAHRPAGGRRLRRRRLRTPGQQIAAWRGAARGHPRSPARPPPAWRRGPEPRGDLLVLDEADRMLDMGFWPDVRRIMTLLPEKRQTLLFSATLSSDVLRHAGPLLTDPVRIEIAPSATPVEAVRQAVYPVNGMQKTDLLVRLLEERKLDRVLVFTRTKHRADKVCRDLERSRIRGAAIHSNRSQAQRQHALDGFKNGTYRVLVATDIVARGIDVDHISHVINYDLPMRRRTTSTASGGRPAPALPAPPSASWPPRRRRSCETSST